MKLLRTLRALGILTALILLAAACSSDRSDDQAVRSDDEPANASNSGGGAQFGRLASPCGDGDGGPAGEQGVLEDRLVIGYGDDAGFSGSPGLNHEQTDAVEALIAWCNDQGGINGRRIEGRYYDAKITEVNNAMMSACREVFMLVGQGWALDGAQEATRVNCGLPSFPSFTVSPAFAHGPLVIQGVPNPVDYLPTHVAAVMAERFPDEVKRAGTLVANYAATLDTRAKVQAAYPEFGFEFLDGCQHEYNIAGESDWKPFAQRLKDCGADFLYFAGSPFPNFVNFLEAAAQLEYQPVIQVDANFYDESFAAWNTNGHGDNVYLRTAFMPLDEADESPAVADYLHLLEEHGGDTSLLGMQATSSWLLWATAVDRCGAEVTRGCVLEEAAQIEGWTAGGLHAPTNPGANLPPHCGIVLKLEGTDFVRVDPEEPAELACDPSYRTKITGPVVDAAKLDENRISTQFGG